MASIAAAKASPYYCSHNNLQRLKISDKFSIKIPNFSDPPSRRLVSAHSNNPNLDSVKMDHTAGSGSKGPPNSPSAAIDFLTLCHRLKALRAGANYSVGGWSILVPAYLLLNDDGVDVNLCVPVVDYFDDSVFVCHDDGQSTKRKGWINHGIKGPESIADHMYRMAVMALIADDLPGVNRERCVKIAIVHDIAEAIVGDITPSDGVPKQEKSKMEQEALDEMCKVLGGGMRAEEIKELWQEYENNSSLEANLVKDFDKVEMILQALEYETEHGKVLDEFFLSTAGKFQTETGKKWAAEITSRRNSRLANRPN